ncbi:mannitol dehydrogenase family protein [Croceicoccus mobilis]|uniref:Mannitol dehydrogenase n=1 Tax=Croceicoccus mobilis TaxID=1703339 RepID=A0A916Z0N4_9SPHN|nr:mannitol dehydrogenase family protein [Croceicoccus mobilis]GGD70375.1 mannitol dehydrogenase [Croceicoccus mobilis]
MRLSPTTLTGLPVGIATPGYDRDAQPIGIVHFGIGAFHRAHQAWYTDLAMNAGESGWAICGVSMRSASVAEQLNPQGGLYSLTERGGGRADTSIIGAVREVLVAPDTPDAVIARIASPDCHIVSFTVTEKGYARAADGSLDLMLAAKSFYPLLTAALEQRQAQGLSGLTLMSCDNLSGNGQALARLMHDWLEAKAPALIDWFDANCACPETMIDRIVPATTDEDRIMLEKKLGMRDEGAVLTESFSQWVIEDRFAGPRPRWENHGAQLVAEVAPYETAKLRMLNGAHSMLAYCGLARGLTYVHEAVADAELKALATDLMLKEAAPTIDAAPEQDLPAYAASLIDRFAEPSIQHRLAQIAMDGSQKIPQRWLETVKAQQEAGNACPSITAAFEAWIAHLEDGTLVNDPHGEELTAVVRDKGREGLLDHLFNTSGIFAGLPCPVAR